MTSWRDRWVCDSGLSTRAKTSLLGEGLRRAGDVAKLSPRQIRLIPGVGPKTAVEISFWLIAVFIADELGMHVA